MGTLNIELLVALLVAVVGVGCTKRDRASATAAPSEAASAGVGPPAALAEGPPPLLTPAVTFLPADGLRGPAFVLHDEASDAYLVSNMDGPPAAADGRGFVSKLDPDGRKILTRWIEGGERGVVLNAPKGMALRRDELYVADIDTVRVFHRTTGAPLDEVKIPGSTYLDDVVLAQDGGILVTDAGLKPSSDGRLEASGTDAVYVIYRDKRSTDVSLVAKERLAGPAGLFATRDKVWSINSRTGELFSIGARGELDDFERLPSGGLEGIVGVGDELLVSSGAASAILRGTPRGAWRIAIGDVKSPAGIGYDRRRARVLVPLRTEDEVRVYALR